MIQMENARKSCAHFFHASLAKFNRILKNYFLLKKDVDISIWHINMDIWFKKLAHLNLDMKERQLTCLTHRID